MSEVIFERAVPILRIFSVEKAKEFYQGFLGFTWEWEHRFGDNFPLYVQISRAGFALHLSEHHGDATPGSATRIQIAGIDSYLNELKGRDYRYYKPAIEQQPWGERSITVTDPFGNRLIFFEPTK